MGLGQEPALRGSSRGLEVYSSGDVTVEELRGEGEEPSLTAEALAERIGEPLAHRRRRLVRDSLLRRGQAARGGRRQHPDRVRAVRDGAWRALARGAPRLSARVTSWGALRRPLHRPVGGRGHLPVLDRASPRSRVRDLRRALGQGAHARDGSGCQDGHRDPLRRPPGGGTVPDRQRRRRQGAQVRRAIVVDFGTSTNFDVVSPERRVRRRCAGAGDRDLDGGALPAGREAGSRSTLPSPPSRDRQDDRHSAPVRPGLWLRRPGGRDRRSPSARSSGVGCAGRRDREAWPS